jgi:hypothetical protein
MTIEVRLLDLVDLCIIRYCNDLPISNFPKEMRDLIKSYLPFQLNNLGKVIDAIHLYDGDLDPHYWERRQITISSIFLCDLCISFGAEVAAALAKAMKANDWPPLTEVDLGHSPIGAEGAAVLADALKVNRTLTKFHFYENSINDAGAAALADALKINSTLTMVT